MKIRNGFVSNSSTSSFIITNTSQEEKTLLDFVKEIEFIYVNDNLSFDEVLKSLSFADTTFIIYPGESLDIWDMGDHYSPRDPLWKSSLESLENSHISHTKSFNLRMTYNH